MSKPSSPNTQDLVREDLARFLARITSYARGEHQPKGGREMIDAMLLELNDGFTLLLDGAELGGRGQVAAWVHSGSAASCVLEQVDIVDVQVWEAHDVWLVTCVIGIGEGRGFVASLFLEGTPGRLRAAHAHFSSCTGDLLRPHRVGSSRLDVSLLPLLNRDVVEKYQCILLRRDGSTLVVALAKPNPTAVEDIEFLTGYTVATVAESADHIRAAIERYYPAQPVVEE